MFLYAQFRNHSNGVGVLTERGTYDLLLVRLFLAYVCTYVHVCVFPSFKYQDYHLECGNGKLGGI